MKKGRIIATSIASIAMCASLVAGGTYALFTSESEVNISVTSGKVKVMATVDGSSLETYSTVDGTKAEILDEKSEFKLGWSNGGFAAISGANVTLDRITPGDGASFDINVTNESNVAIQYKVSLTAEDADEDKTVDLMEALEVTFTAADGTVKTMNGNELLWSNWTFVEAGNDFTDTVSVNIYMPNKADDENNTYQDQSVMITCKVEAVQGNATIEQPEKEDNLAIYNADEFVAFAESVNNGATYAGKTVELMRGFSLAGIDWRPIGTNADDAAKFQGTFEGNDNTLSDLTIDTADEDAYQATGLFGALNGTLQNLTIKNATVNGFSAGSTNPETLGWTDNGIAVVAGSIYTAGTIDNVHVVGATVEGNRYVGGISGYTYGNVTNCSVTNATLTAIPDGTEGNYDNGDKVGGIAGAYWSEGVYTIANNKVNNLTIKGYRDLGGIVGAANGEDTVTNNESSNVTIVCDRMTNNYGDKDKNVGAIVGRFVKGNALGEGNTYTNFEWYTLIADGLTMDADGVYHITGENGLMYFSGKEFANATIVLDADLDMNNAAMVSIAPKRDGGVLNFDGNNHTISNIAFSLASAHNGTDAAAMFQVTPNSSLTVFDLNLDGVKVDASYDSYDDDKYGYASALISYNEGTAILTNVDVNYATIKGNKSSGVLCGHNCAYATLTMTGCDITNSSVTVSNHFAGALIGTTFSNCHTTENCTVDTATQNSITGGRNSEYTNAPLFGRIL